VRIGAVGSGFTEEIGNVEGSAVEAGVLIAFVCRCEDETFLYPFDDRSKGTG
jgi:hypothetical protein